MRLLCDVPRCVDTEQIAWTIGLTLLGIIAVKVIGHLRGT